ncbi:MAG TPA: phosphohistidine phosphatase SixA [Pirellulales bacterium]
MLLYIVRHAWAGQHGDPEYPDDSLRPLTAKGEKRFRRVAKRLAKRGFAPCHVATSPLVRCRQTADILMDHLDSQAQLTVLNELAPGARLEALLPWARQQPSGDLAWVGHAPDVSQWIAALIGSAAGHADMDKGAVAAIEFDGAPEVGAGTLRWLVTAEVLGV